MKYLVTITKQGCMFVDADSIEAAEDLARDLEADGSFEMDLYVTVEAQDE